MTMVRPDVEVTPGPAMTIDWDVPITVRDGTVLRVNVFRPAAGGPWPAVMCAHPYGKDNIPRKTRRGRGLNVQFRLFPQPERIHISDLTGREAPDPGWWVTNGYAVVNADLRGGGTSEGVDDLFSDAEAYDYYDLIEWVGTQPWCTGKVGLNGVSYLAISEYKAAATHPPHLAAICPWEGFSDLYREFTHPGGIRETGFTFVWATTTTHGARVEGKLGAEFKARPDLDDWYRARTPILEHIEVPMLQCASFSDQSLHSRGSFEAFRRSGSARKWLTTHRSGKWSWYYGPQAKAEMLAFFDHVLKGLNNGWDTRPSVRVRVYEDGPDAVDVLDVGEWPPTELEWTTLNLDAASGRLAVTPPLGTATAIVDRAPARFLWTVPSAMDLIGPMALRLMVSLPEGGDANVFVTARKYRRGEEVRFEGSYGYPHDAVSHGWQRLAHRTLDDGLSTECQPVHTHDRVEPASPGEVVAVQVALLPHATRFQAGDSLAIDVGLRWPVSRNPLRGQFPAAYVASKTATCTLHTGGDVTSDVAAGRADVGRLNCGRGL
jgi:uncharacterized protein